MKDLNYEHMTHNKPYLVRLMPDVDCEYNVAAPNLQCAAYVATQEFGEENIFSIERFY